MKKSLLLLFIISISNVSGKDLDEKEAAQFEAELKEKDQFIEQHKNFLKKIIKSGLESIFAGAQVVPRQIEIPELEAFAQDATIRTYFSFSPNGQYLLITVGTEEDPENNHIYLFDLKNHTKTKFKNPDNISDGYAYFNINNDFFAIVVSKEGNNYYLWNTKNNSVIKLNGVKPVFSPNNKYVITSEPEPPQEEGAAAPEAIDEQKLKTVYLTSMANLKQLEFKIKGQKYGFAMDDRYLVFESEDGINYLINLITLEKQEIKKGTCFDITDKFLVQEIANKYSVQDLETGKVHDLEISKIDGPTIGEEFEKKPEYCPRFQLKEDLLITALGNMAYLWDLNTLKYKKFDGGHKTIIHHVELDVQKKLAVTASFDKICVWDLKTNTVKEIDLKNNQEYYHVDRYDENMVVIDFEGKFKIFSLNTKQLLEGEGEGYHSNKFALVVKDGTVDLYDLCSFKMMKSFRGQFELYDKYGLIDAPKVRYLINFENGKFLILPKNSIIWTTNTKFIVTYNLNGIYLINTDNLESVRISNIAIEYLDPSLDLKNIVYFDPIAKRIFLLDLDSTWLINDLSLDTLKLLAELEALKPEELLDAYNKIKNRLIRKIRKYVKLYITQQIIAANYTPAETAAIVGEYLK